MSGISREGRSTGKSDLSFEMEIDDLSVHSIREGLQKNVTGTLRVVTDFTLLRGSRLRNPTQEESDVLWKLFPTIFGIGIHASCLIIHVRELPKAPWPISVAGVPLFLTTSRDDRGFDHGDLGLGPEILKDTKIDGLGKGLENILFEIVRHLRKAGAKVFRIACLYDFLDITLIGSIDIKRVPQKAAGLMCEYKVKDTGAQPALEYVRRGKEPGAYVDDTNYLPDLRPGVMLNSGCYGKSDFPMSTTSGVTVKLNA